MIKFQKGDIFSSKVQTLVATVNCVGIMGKGIAKEFRQRFSSMYKEYVKACKQGELRIGKLWLYRELDKQILCFPTKDNWKGPSKYEFIEEGLKELRRTYREKGINSLAIPPLGCGMGGLRWDKVKELIIQYLSDLPIEIEVYEPLDIGNRIPRKNPFKNMNKIKLTPSTIYTGEMIRIAQKYFGERQAIGRLLLQKIAFFSQLAGLPIKLSFTKYNLGPYDYKLTFNIDKLEGLFIRDASSTIERSNLSIIDEVKWLSIVEQINSYSEFVGVNIKHARASIEKAVEFLIKYNFRDIELLSTVMFAWISLVSSGHVGISVEIKEFVERWKSSKFSANEIEYAVKELIDAGWLNPKISNPKGTLQEITFCV